MLLLDIRNHLPNYFAQSREDNYKRNIYLLAGQYIIERSGYNEHMENKMKADNNNKRRWKI